MQTLSKEVNNSKCAKHNLDNISTNENDNNDISNISLHETNSEEIEKFCENIINLSGALNAEKTFGKEYILKKVKNLSAENDENINESVESLSSLLSFDKCSTADNCVCAERQPSKTSCLCKHEDHCLPFECSLSSKMKCNLNEVNDNCSLITSENSEESTKVTLQSLTETKSKIYNPPEVNPSTTQNALEDLEPYFYQELKNTLKIKNFDDMNNIKLQKFDPQSINLKALADRYCSEYEKSYYFSNGKSPVVESNCNQTSQNGGKTFEGLLNPKYNNVYESLNEDYVENKPNNQCNAYAKSGSSRSSRYKMDLHKLDKQACLEKLVEYINQSSVSAN